MRTGGEFNWLVQRSTWVRDGPAYLDVLRTHRYVPMHQLRTSTARVSCA